MQPADQRLSAQNAGGSAQSSELLALRDAALLLGLKPAELLALLERAKLGLHSLDGEPAVTMNDLIELRKLRYGRLKALRAKSDPELDDGPLDENSAFELWLLHIRHDQVSERLASLQTTFRDQSDELETLREELALSRSHADSLEPAESKLAGVCTELAAARAELAEAQARVCELVEAQGLLPQVLEARTRAVAEVETELEVQRAENARMQADLARVNEDLARSDDGWRAERRRAADQNAELERRLEARVREFEGLRCDSELAAARGQNELEQLADQYAHLETLERSLSRYTDRLEQKHGELRRKA